MLGQLGPQRPELIVKKMHPIGHLLEQAGQRLGMKH
jgi:hypothetical protein